MGLIQDLQRSIDENASHIASGNVLPHDKRSMQIDNANARSAINALRGLFKYTPTPNGLPDGVKPEDVLFNFYIKEGYCDQYLEINEGSHNAYHECVFCMHEKHGLQSCLFLGGGWVFHDHTDYIDVSPVRYILDKLGITPKKGVAQ